MPKTIVDVGNCDMDHASLQMMLDANFEVELVRAHSAEEALKLIRSGNVDLVLINRKLDRDQADGVELIERVKGEPELAATPCMLISNFEESQQQAIDAGAERGFGKRQLDDAATRERLAKLLA